VVVFSIPYLNYFKLIILELKVLLGVEKYKNNNRGYVPLTQGTEFSCFLESRIDIVKLEMRGKGTVNMCGQIL